MPFDKKRSLQDLESQDWGPPSYASSLVATCHKLRRKPLGEFTTEDLRIMIGQQIGLKYLLPMAVERLSGNPLASGDFYNGDLLKAVLCVDSTFWKENEDLWWLVKEIVVGLEAISKTIQNELIPAAERFRRSKQFSEPDPT